jgi:hypothetical protein
MFSVHSKPVGQKMFIVCSGDLVYNTAGGGGGVCTDIWAFISVTIKTYVKYDCMTVQLMIQKTKLQVS